MFEGKPLYYTSEFQGNKEKADEPDDVVVPQYKDVEETQNKKNTIAPRNMWERIWYNIKYSKGLNAITNGRIDIYLAYWDKMNFKGHASTSMVVDGEKKTIRITTGFSLVTPMDFSVCFFLWCDYVIRGSVFFEILPDTEKKKMQHMLFDTGNLYRICYCYTDGMFVSAV